MHLITSYSPNRLPRFKEVVYDACNAGVSVVQFSFHGDDIQAYRLAEWVRKTTLDFNVLMCVNNRLDIANIVNADFLHIGQNDLPINVVRKHLDPSIKIGLTVTNVCEFNELADYYGVGPVLPTFTKNIRNDAIGFDRLGDICRQSNKPVVGIGGVDINNAKDFINSGCDDVAVIGDIYESDSVYDQVKKYEGLKYKAVTH